MIVNLWWFIDQLLLSLGEKEAKKTVSFKLAYCAGIVSEALFKLLPTKKEPPITRFVALQMGKSHFFSHSAAKRDFGYRPVISTQEGLEELLRGGAQLTLRG